MKITKISAVVFLMSGCDSQVDMVNREMAKPVQVKRVVTTPVMSLAKVPPFTYAAHDLRSPFVSVMAMEESNRPKGQDRSLILNHRQQVLAHIALDHLQFKGRLSAAGVAVALIQSPDGRITSVHTGQYLGLNQARIIKISATQIDMIERVVDAKGGHVKRKRSMMLAVTQS